MNKDKLINIIVWTYIVAIYNYVYGERIKKFFWRIKSKN